MPLVLIRVPFMGGETSLPRRLQASTYRRAGLVLTVGHASVLDVTDEQLRQLEADPRLEVEPFTGDASAYPKALPSGFNLSQDELAARIAQRRSQ